MNRAPIPPSRLVTRAALATALLGSAASAQCGLAGVDLIACDVTTSANFAASATHDAVMFGALLCNIGVVDAPWSGTTHEHPLVVEALYRLQHVAAGTRFEQIGMSWAHHELTALNWNTPCGCTGGNAAHLGSGCSSPSTIGPIETSTSYGPRIDVDPGASQLAWPPSTTPAPPGASAGRVRFALADADPSATYVAEVQVVGPGEDGNARHDDASWRRVQLALAGGNATFTLQGATTTRQSALAAWAQLAPNVGFVSQILPNKETIEFAWEVSDLGGGWWRYEYAVHNQDLTEGLLSFRVPIPAGVAVREIGFHDVDYHGGDGVGGTADGTDWVAELGGGELVWSTETFASNPNANALRWGTTYNFRFDASAPPSSGSVSMDHFQGGGGLFTQAIDTPSTPTYAAFCAGDGSAAPCPCGNASAIGSGEGCASSLGIGGRLAAGGSAQIANDRLVLIGTGMPNSSALYFQGLTSVGGGAGAPFGDGLRCAGGTTVRIAIRANVGGASQYPEGSEPTVSVRGLVTSPATRTYQVWYRNPASFCTPSTFNLTNGVTVSWS